MCVKQTAFNLLGGSRVYVLEDPSFMDFDDFNHGSYVCVCVCVCVLVFVFVCV